MPKCGMNRPGASILDKSRKRREGGRWRNYTGISERGGNREAGLKKSREQKMLRMYRQC